MLFRSYLGYVATDNRQGGVEAAKRLIEVLKGKSKPKVMMIRYQTGSESTEQRELGFRETIKAAGNIDYSEAADEAGATVDSAQKTVERVLSDTKDLDGLFIPNESSTTGALQAIRVLKREGQFKFVGFDGSEILIQAVREGRLQGVVLQDPFDMGYQAVKRAVDFTRGKLTLKEKTVHTNLKLLTKENMDDASIKPLYSRDLSSYLGK